MDMQLFVEADGFEIDSATLDFIRATAVFAIWRDGRSARIEVRLEREEGAIPGVGCTVRAELECGATVCVAARGGDLCEAVQEACDRLEAHLHPSRPAAPDVEAPIAA